MKIKKISKNKKNQILLFLDNETYLCITEQELLDFHLYIEKELDQQTIEELKKSTAFSRVKAEAAEIVGRHAISRRDLEKKLQKKGAEVEAIQKAVEWLEIIGVLNDAEYAAALARHYIKKGYGAAYIRSKFYEKGIERELGEDIISSLSADTRQIDAFLFKKLRGETPDREEKKRLTAALQRRGFSWDEIRDAWTRYHVTIED